jgi:uncharacterized protein YjbJ (UPF0337 family)
MPLATTDRLRFIELKAKGKVREQLGACWSLRKMTNNKTEQLKGKIEQAEGKVREEIGRSERKNKNK